MIATYHVTACSPEIIGENFWPITHFGDPRTGLVQAYRSILISETVPKKKNPNFIAHSTIYVYEANLDNNNPLHVNDHGAPNAAALLDYLRPPRGKLISEQEFRDFKAQNFDLMPSSTLGERATLPGRERAAEIIRGHKHDIIMYENTNSEEKRGVEIFSDFFRQRFNFAPQCGETTCFISLSETKPKLLFEIDRSIIDGICEEKEFKVL